MSALSALGVDWNAQVQIFQLWTYESSAPHGFVPKVCKDGSAPSRESGNTIPGSIKPGHIFLAERNHWGRPGRSGLEPIHQRWVW